MLDFSDAFLLVAAESGVLRSTLTGEEAVTIGGDLSGESNCESASKCGMDYY